MNYQRHYDVLIARARIRELDGYSERHHVVPRCLGGDNSTDNIVRLTAEEHYVAHQLLVKIHPGNHRLIWAASAMTGRTRKQSGRNNKLYGWLRRRFAEAISNRRRGIKVSDEAREKMSKSHLGVKRGPHSAEHKARLSAAHMGKKKSPEHIAKMARSKTGKKTGPRSDATRKRQSEAIRLALVSVDRSWMNSQEYKEQRREQMLRVWERRRNKEAAMPNYSKRTKG